MTGAMVAGALLQDDVDMIDDMDGPLTAYISDEIIDATRTSHVILQETPHTLNVSIYISE